MICLQQISVYRDGDEYCARLGPSFPEHVAAGFCENPIEALEALVVALKTMKKEDFLSLDWE